MSTKKDNYTIDIFPQAEAIQRIKRARKEIDDIKPIDIIDQLDDVVDIALDGEKPQCSAAVSALVAKAKILGFLDSAKNVINNIEKQTITVTDLSDAELDRIINGG